MSYPHSCVLLIGATSGIGLAMAETFVASGSKVIVVGRRKDRLDAFVAKHGVEKVGAFQFDITETTSIPKFVSDVTDRYPEIDCVFLNAGRGTAFNFAEPSSVDIDEFHRDMDINFTSHVNLTHAFLPFLMAKQTPTTIT
jgi:NADP-dependent 3-hydroxy acid dehydrogenase YdfG